MVRGQHAGGVARRVETQASLPRAHRLRHRRLRGAADHRAGDARAALARHRTVRGGGCPRRCGSACRRRGLDLRRGRCWTSRTGKVWMKQNLALVYDTPLKPLPGALSVFSNEPVTCTVTPLGGPPRTESVAPDTPLKIDRPPGTMHVKCVKPGSAAFERTVQ